MSIYAPEALPIHNKLPEPKVGLTVVQQAYDSLLGLLKAKANAPDLQPGAITTDPAHGIDAEKQGLVDTLNAEQKTATTASTTIEHWKEAEGIGNKTEADAKAQGGIVVDAGGKRTGEFYWKDSSGAIHGPEQIMPAYAGGIRGLRRQKAEGDNSATLAYDALRNGDAVRVVFTKPDGTQDALALTLRDFDTMITTEAAKRWDADASHKIKFADLQKKHSQLAHAYSRRVEDDIAKNAQYSFHHLEDKAKTIANRKPEEPDPDIREKNALEFGRTIRNAIIAQNAENLANIKPDYSFGVLNQYLSYLEAAQSSGTPLQRNLLTAIITSAAQECLENNSHLLAQNVDLRDRLDRNYYYYNQPDPTTNKERDLIKATVKDLLVQIDPKIPVDKILDDIHPHTLVALTCSMGRRVKQPEDIDRIVNSAAGRYLTGGEAYALQTLAHAGRLPHFQELLSSALGIKPEHLQNPQQFMQQHIGEIGEIRNSGGAILPKDQVQAVCQKLTNYEAALQGVIKYAGGLKGIQERGLDFLRKNWMKGVFIGMLLQMLQSQFEKDMQTSGGQRGGAPE